VVEIATQDNPINRSAITVVQSSRVLPTKQYQCGKKFVESRARELSHITEVAQVSAINPSFTARGVKPRADFVASEAPAGMRRTAFRSSRVSNT
jgi:hypothetical protein